MFLTVNDHNLHATVAGDPKAPVLVLLHSLGTEAALWDAQVAAFSATHRVICPEFRGHGASEESQTPLTCEALASDILEMLDQMGVGDFTLSGCSLGGVVAQLVAAEAGARVKGLAIFNSYVKSLDPQMWRDRAAKIRADGLTSIAGGVLGIWMTEADRMTPEGKGLARILSRATDEGYAAACDALAVVDCRDAAAKITAPTIVAFGSEDKAAPHTASEALADAIQGASLRAIEGAAHLPLLHYPDASSAILKELT
ncbi:3-oxoadipate enol-lactonase/3-oxoadipate enol-lactonase/4-carboxymuconolactone decarboxylase [Maritimibacter alkaliphilus HTCC2654]|uniref:PcaL, 3-oxoadipate enol-lactone hydrolase n=1 Tax=Maritimibacter alkaliphilus HTCC2654 TaxID=314271 RepID=A3VDL9_9RHOB|nr:alpha/beta fold hydrolase [Maritimibacter alkaliphilus]EAQ13608.1 PcaL, 3-oxoadipate enol-lactone hydrolase [Maritimibacter alkaliphilus HTCC2654]TYP83447.1 3-oxoadipate enol-lactonase/3-oxoadipate enol-lactonase/4-carboxymuconolactone decarboxylase [Maritimibacter alkaliphilus HTCC2654]